MHVTELTNHPKTVIIHLMKTLYTYLHTIYSTCTCFSSDDTLNLKINVGF